jgi:hypothetical protein
MLAMADFVGGLMTGFYIMLAMVDFVGGLMTGF